MFKTPFLPLTPQIIPLPLPTKCSVHFGEPLHFSADRAQFRHREVGERPLEGGKLQAADIGTGWSWVSNLGEGDMLNFVGIAFLAGVTIICYLAIVPINPVRQPGRCFSRTELVFL